MEQNNNMNLNENVNQNSEKNDKKDPSNQKRSRRGFLKGAALGVVAGAMFSGSKSAHADPVGGDTVILTEIAIWLKTTWVAEILPLINTITEWYKTVKGWINSWNDFITKFNEGMSLAQDVRDFFTKKEDNWFYQSYVQLKDYINRMMKVDGDILKYRLHYFEPILITKIDSMINAFDSLVSRAENSVKAYMNLGVKKNTNSDPMRQTKEGKLVIRATTDQAKYLEAQARLLSLKQTLELTKNQFPSLTKFNTSTENSARLFHDLIAPQMLETNLLSCSILSEIYIKLNDLFLILSKEDPIIGNNENVVTKDQMKKVLSDLSCGDKKGFII